MTVHGGDYKLVREALGIPEDEPIFVIRGQDKFSVPLLERYRNFTAAIKNPTNEQDELWLRQLTSKINEFVVFHDENPKRVKLPD